MSTSSNHSDISATHLSAVNAIDHAIEFLSAELKKQRFVVPSGESTLYLEMRRDLPYAIHETEIQGTQILVNRNYKPLGSSLRTGEGWVVYEAATNGHVQLTPEQIASLVSPRQIRNLFGEEGAPWCGRRHASEYIDRLRSLRDCLSSPSLGVLKGVQKFV